MSLHKTYTAEEKQALTLCNLKSNCASQLSDAFVLGLRQSDTKVKELTSTIKDIKTILYGQGFEVANWHLNGDLEPLDNFFDENGW